MSRIHDDLDCQDPTAFLGSGLAAGPLDGRHRGASRDSPVVGINGGVVPMIFTLLVTPLVR